MFAYPIIYILECKYRVSSKEKGAPILSQLHTRRNYSLLLWLIVSLASTVLFSPNSGQGLWNWFQLALGAATYILVSNSDHKIEYVKSITTIIPSLLYFYVLLDFFGTKEVRFLNLSLPLRSSSGDFIGFSFERNLLASQALLCLALTIYYRQKLRPKIIKIHIPLLIIIAIGQTRSVWIALGFMTLLLLGSKFPVGKKIPLVFFLLATPAIYIFLRLRVLEDSTGLTRFSLLFDTSSGTGAYRLDIYKRALEEVVSGLLPLTLGHGIGTYGQVHSIDVTNVQAEYLSSVWVAILHSSGLLGLGFFCLAILFMIKNSRYRMEALVVFTSVFIPATTTTPFLLAFPWVGLALIRDKST
jgi:hypothetical protein